ncbi:restriction endonuclease subunit S [Streptomyces rubiginosohelvolus]|uniref:restriction endonuclease subunit S n=1 Tax=Streptomyces rubiginosohelvolus TaxID=67362 RepID=UPI0036EAD7CF
MSVGPPEVANARLETIPAGWSITKLGRTARIGNGSTPRREKREYWDHGVVPWLNSSVVNQARVGSSAESVAAAALAECHLPIISPGSVLVGLTGQGKTRGMATILDIEATVNQHLAYVTPDRSRWCPEFLLWSLTAAYHDLRRISEENGSTKGGLTCEALKQLRVLVPPIDEQRRIAFHLNEQAAKTDTLIEEQQRLIELLRERRGAVVSEAIGTCWSQTRLGHVLVGIKDGTHGSFERRASGEGRPLLGARNVMNGAVVIDGQESFISDADAESIVANGYPSHGDVLLVIVGATIGKTALYELDERHAFQRSVAFLRTNDLVDSRFLWRQIQSKRFQDELALRAKTSAQPGIYMGDVVAIPVYVPPIEHQRRIAAGLDRQIAKIDALIAETERFIELSKERRAALVAAAVTGQIDVREVA